jgi:hypothetical protein
LNQTDSFETMSYMWNNSGVTPFTFTDTGNCCKPYTVKVYAKFRDASGDVTLSWWPRVRQNGLWLSGSDVAIPAKDTPETYSIDVLSSNKATVLNTYAVTGDLGASWTYTAAMQTADFGSTQSTINFVIYQISTVVGRGFAIGVTF